MRCASVLRSKTLAEAEFISAEHFDLSGLPKRRRPFWETRVQRGHAEAARRTPHRRHHPRGRIIQRSAVSAAALLRRAGDAAKGSFSHTREGPPLNPQEARGCPPAIGKNRSRTPLPWGASKGRRHIKKRPRQRSLFISIPAPDHEKTRERKTHRQRCSGHRKAF